MAAELTSEDVEYIVPDGYAAIVRDVDVSSAGDENTNWGLAVVGGATFAGGSFTSIGAAQYQQWRGRQVVNPGETLVAFADGSRSIMVSGYLLTLP
jgi:hypothetical protein